MLRTYIICPYDEVILFYIEFNDTITNDKL